jgi:hypothetical protein
MSRKPGQQHRAAEVAPLGRRAARVVRGHDVDDAIAIDEHGRAFDEALFDEHAAVEQRERAHSVSVTLLRCGGRSGSRPRASASVFAMR